MIVCADCNRALSPPCVSVAMRPGRDGREWSLCSSCWIKSTQPEPMVTMDAVKSLRPKTTKRERQGQH